MYNGLKGTHIIEWFVVGARPSYMEYGELEAIKKCKDGNLEAFGSLYSLYTKKIYNFLFYRTYRKELAEDIASVAFMKALENIGQFDERKGNFSSWLYRIAQNALIDHVRKERPSVPIEDVFDLGEGDNTEEKLDIGENLKEVKKYLKELSAEQRELVRLRVWDELSYKEIAELTGKSEGSCKVMFSRIVAKMQKEIPHVLLLLAIFRIYKGN